MIYYITVHYGPLVLLLQASSDTAKMTN